MWFGHRNLKDLAEMAEVGNSDPNWEGVGSSEVEEGRIAGLLRRARWIGLVEVGEGSTASSVAVVGE